MVNWQAAGMHTVVKSLSSCSIMHLFNSLITRLSWATAAIQLTVQLFWLSSWVIDLKQHSILILTSSDLHSDLLSKCFCRLVLTVDQQTQHLEQRALTFTDWWSLSFFFYFYRWNDSASYDFSEYFLCLF